MANKKITLTLEESLVKAFEDRYGDTKSWLLGEFSWRATQVKKEIIEEKVRELLSSEEVTQIPGTESEILTAYYEGKTSKESQESNSEEESEG